MEGHVRPTIHVCADDPNEVDVCVDNQIQFPEKSAPHIRVLLFGYPQRTCLYRPSKSGVAVPGSCGMYYIFLAIFAITLKSLSVSLLFATLSLSFFLALDVPDALKLIISYMLLVGNERQ
jgi:hypothetical protein